MIRCIDDGAARSEQDRIDLITIDSAETGIAWKQADRRGTVLEDITDAPIVIFGRAETDKLTLRPGSAAMHGRVDAAGVGILTGKTEIGEVSFAAPVARGVERIDLDTRTIADRPIVFDPALLLIGSPLAESKL